MKTYEPLSSPIDSLHTWRLQALIWILRGQFPFWVLAYLAGIWSAVQTYRENSRQAGDNPEGLLAAVVAAYSIVMGSMAVITFVSKLGYRSRVFTMLGVYYFLSILLFGLSALSGDARGFLFAFIVLAAVFLDKDWNLLSLTVALLTFAVMGGLHVSGIIQLPFESQYNAMEAKSWLSGGIVFATLSISTSLGITYLLRSFTNSLRQSNQSLHNEQRAVYSLRMLGDINQLIIRERRPEFVLNQACEIIVKSGYDFACIGQVRPESSALLLIASAGSSPIPEAIPEFAVQAIQSLAPVLAPSTIAIPIHRPYRNFGVLVIIRQSDAYEFSAIETALFQELADDLAYALENIEIETQRRAIVETAPTLLAARDENEIWSAILPVVQLILHTNHAAVYTYEPNLGGLACRCSVGLSHEYLKEIIQRFREMPENRLFQDPKLILVSDINSESLASPLRSIFQREGIRSYIVFPLFSAEKLLGSLVVYYNQQTSFPPSEIEAGQTLAHLLAASLQNTRLLAETRAKAAEQSALFIAAQEISASLLNTPALLEVLARQLAITLNATSVYVVSLNPTDDTLMVLAEYWGEAANPTERKSDLGRVYQAQDFPHVVQSMKSGKSITLQADSPDLTEAERKDYSEFGSHTKLFVPLLAPVRWLATPKFGKAAGSGNSASMKSTLPRRFPLMRQVSFMLQTCLQNWKNANPISVP